MPCPEISVLLPARNAAGTIGAAIASLLHQTAGDFELLVLDDASTDRTAEVAHAFDDPRIRVLRSAAQQGISKRLNEGIALASGRYIARMDADDWAFPERFEQQRAFLDRHAEVDLLGTRAIVVDSRGALRHAFPFRETHQQLCAWPWNGFYLCHPTWMGRAEWFRRWGYPDPDCTRAEDQQLLLRSHHASRFHCLPRFLLVYRQDVPRFALRHRGRRSLLRAQLTEFGSRRRLDASALAVAAYLGKTLVDSLLPILPIEWARSAESATTDPTVVDAYRRYRRMAGRLSEDAARRLA